MTRSNQDIRVIVAEDEYLVAREILRGLKTAGFEVIGEATTGIEVVSLVKELHPHVVLMDIQMPEMNGLEATRQLQLECPTPVVVLTAHESEELVEEAGNAGVSAYLTKPPDTKDIERAVTIALARHEDLMKTRALVEELKESKKAEASAMLEAQRWKTANMFSVTIAHEFNNPLAIMRGKIDLMKMGRWKLAEVKSGITTIDKQIQRMESLVQKILNIKELKEIPYAGGMKILDLHDSSQVLEKHPAVPEK